MSKLGNTLGSLYDAIYFKTGSTRETEKAMSPLYWYIYSGRMPIIFEERLNSRTAEQIDHIAGRLVKNASASYEKSIASVKQLLGIRKNF